MENYQLYALCYGCHERNTVLDRAGGFSHRLHVVDIGAGCAVCHDAHGSRSNPHLINFMTRDLTGEAVVTPSSSGTLEYDSLGSGTGRCFLTCHGVDHNPKEYSAAARGSGAIVPRSLHRNGTLPAMPQRGGRRLAP
jgi:predicted CXXCH cytochrome family protein